MRPSTFEFGAEPALTKAAFRLLAAERSLLQAMSIARAAKKDLCPLEEKVANLKQQKCAAYDNIAVQGTDDTPPHRAILRGTYIKSLREEILCAEKAVSQQLETLRWEEHRVACRRAELNRAQASVRALEKLKESAKREYHRQCMRREENRQNDEAILQFNGRSRVP